MNHPPSQIPCEPAADAPPPAASPAQNNTRGLEKYAVIILAATASVMMLWGLNNVDLRDADEPRYAEVAREMAASGDYVLLHYNGEKYPNKPPLYFWLVAACSKLTGGVNEVSARMPSALAGVAVVLLTFALGRRMFGARAGFLAGMVLLSSLYFVEHARSVHMDLPLAVFTTAMIAVFYLAYEQGKAAWWTWPVFFLMGLLGILMKGPAGFLPPLLACIAFSLLRRDWRGWGRSLWISVFVVVAIACLWLVVLWRQSGNHFIWNTLISQNADRLTGRGSHVEPFYFFLRVFPEIFLPWTPFLLLALVMAAARIWRRDESAWKILFILVWFAVTFIFFSAVPSKRQLYILAAFPAAAIAVAWLLEALIAGKAPEKIEAFTRWLTAAAMTLVAAAAPLGLLMLAWAEVKGGERVAGMIEDLRRSYVVMVILSVILCAQGLAGVQAALRRYWAGAVTAILLICLTSGAATMFVFFPLFDKAKSARHFSARLNEAAGNSEVAAYEDVPEGIVFYARRRFPLLRTPGEAAAYLNREDGATRFCITKAKGLSEIKTACGNREMPEEVFRDKVEGDELVLLRSRSTVDQINFP